MAKPEHPVLSARRLNRATLARQRLLERTALSAVDALEAIGGVQAQEPATPFIALWARVRDFQASELQRAFFDREVVKATLMRVTLHAVSRRDYRSFLPALLPMLRTLRRRDSADRPTEARLQRYAAAVVAFAASPRTNTELRDHVAKLVEGPVADDVWWMIRRQAALVHVPDGVAWSFTRRPTLVAADVWLGDDPFAEAGVAVGHLVRHYLAAFGPATAADIAAWAGLPVASLRPGIEMGAARRYRDERGRELLDVADAPLPEEDVAAPPRLLPMWDSTLLAYADRTRIVSDPERALVIARNGDVAPTFLVDGFVAGLWWTERSGSRTRIVLEPFRSLSRADRAALDEEGERLAEFLEPHEPTAYARYRTSGARRLGGIG